VRSYARVRSGEQVELAARPVTVFAFDLLGMARRSADSLGSDLLGSDSPGADSPDADPAGAEPLGTDLVDLSVAVECSSGTYIRALARDLGAALGVGGHLTALRRTRVGPYDLTQAHPLSELEAAAEAGGPLPILPIGEAAAAAFPRYDVDARQAESVAHGGFLPARGLGPGPVAVFGPDASFLALFEERGAVAKPVAVFV
jgi:tRNA pseudouridine55 synthase